MHKLIFRKICAYNPTLNGKTTRFDGYNQITKGLVDPSIEPLKAELAESLDVSSPIFASSLQRGRDSAQLWSKKLGIEQIYYLNELAEIKFILEDLLTEEEYNLHGSPLVRERFVSAFIQDKLPESRQQIERSVKSVFESVLAQSTGEYLLISHSFKMKIIEAYIHEKGLFSNPELLKDFIKPQEKTYPFTQGFEVKI